MMLESILSPMRALFGLIIIPPWLKTRSTGAEVAGTDCTFIASLNLFKLGNSLGLLCQNSRQSSGSSSSSSSILASSSAHIVKYLWYSDSDVVAISFTDVPVFGQEYLARS